MTTDVLPTAIIKIGLDPVLFHLGPIAVHWYGLMYVVGLAAGMYVLLPYAEELGFSRDTSWQVFWPVLIGSLIGGRLYYVVQSDLGYYLRHPQDIVATWEGGMAFYGAVFGGLLAAFITCRLKGLSFPLVLDCATLLIPLAQTFGRFGNIVNGDILGYPSNLPWATQYTNPNNTFVPSHQIAYQPAAAYELLFSLGLFVLVYSLRHRFSVPGTLFVLWAVVYSVGQYLLFFARANSVVLFGLKQAQLTAIVVVLLVVPAYLYWRRFYLEREERREQEPSLEAAGAVSSGTGGATG